MARINPPEITLSPGAPSDPRLGHLLGSRLKAGDEPQVVILGFPSDEGVRRNGGRPGAAEGPRTLRRALYRLAPDARSAAFAALLSRTLDLGDLEVSGDVERDQQTLGEVLSSHLSSSTFVVVLGGGHETSYGHFLGYATAGRSVEILNWDAHADVRELAQGKAHSGSPFRQAIEHRSGACRRYTVAGLQPSAVAQTHLDFVEQHGRAIWREEVSDDTIGEVYATAGSPTLVSFDLDAVSQAEAPGVSAPTADGLPVRLWLEAAFQAGRSPSVTSADIVELNPQFDVDGQTARLAALTVWWVLRGCAERG